MACPAIAAPVNMIATVAVATVTTCIFSASLDPSVNIRKIGMAAKGDKIAKSEIVNWLYSNQGSIRRSPRSLVVPSGSIDGRLRRIVPAHDLFGKVGEPTSPPG